MVGRRPAGGGTSCATQADSAAEGRQQLRALIQLGRERGYLRHADISDHLEGNFADTAAMESLPMLQRFSCTKVQRRCRTTRPTKKPKLALSTIDSEFGRTTDPVRMYMREMSSATLLTRKEEVEIARRIEDGLNSMVHAIAACPSTIATILEMSDHVARDEMRIDELVDGLIDDGLAETDDAAGRDDTGRRQLFWRPADAYQPGLLCHRQSVITIDHRLTPSSSASLSALSKNHSPTATARSSLAAPSR
jgi:RNA polymerase primary sigma factor